MNVQGDEPFINPNQITQLLKMFENTNIQIASLARKIDNYERWPHLLKTIQTLFWNWI